MTSILSSGFGRLHFAQSAYWLSRAGVAIKLVCGWVPRNTNSWLVRLCSKCIGRDLSAGMKKRAIQMDNGGEVLSCAWADFLCQGLFILDRKVFGGRFHGRVASLAWRIFGWHSRRYLKRYCHDGSLVFHVRSGGGHGGSIKLAQKLNVPVIVDHSIAHPAYMEKHLRLEYEKNGVLFDLGMDSPFWRMIAEECEWADILLVNSFFVRDTCIEQGIPESKIRVAYLGTRPDFFGLRKVRSEGRGQRKLNLLFTGNFSFRKGAEYLLEALRILKERAEIIFEMDVVGAYGESQGLIDRYKQFELPISFRGPVPQDDLKRFLAEADIYVFPSLAEGCACSGMEAMAAGLCVVGTHESGFPIDDGVNGCVVPGKDAEAIAEKILYLATHPAEIDRIGAAAAELIRTKYTWEQHAENVKAVYKEALNEKRKAVQDVKAN